MVSSHAKELANYRTKIAQSDAQIFMSQSQRAPQLSASSRHSQDLEPVEKYQILRTGIKKYWSICYFICFSIDSHQEAKHNHPNKKQLTKATTGAGGCWSVSTILWVKGRHFSSRGAASLCCIFLNASSADWTYHRSIVSSLLQHSESGSRSKLRSRADGDRIRGDEVELNLISGRTIFIFLLVWFDSLWESFAVRDVELSFLHFKACGEARFGHFLADIERLALNKRDGVNRSRAGFIGAELDFALGSLDTSSISLASCIAYSAGSDVNGADQALEICVEHGPDSKETDEEDALCVSVALVG